MNTDYRSVTHTLSIQVVWCEKSCNLPPDLEQWSPHREFSGSHCLQKKPSSVLREKQPLNSTTQSRMCEVTSHISKQMTLQTGWFLIQQNIFLCMSNLITHRVAVRFVPRELDLPWLCGQSSRWKMTIRGLFLKHKVASLTFNHWLHWMSKAVSVSQFLTLTWTSRDPPHKSEPRPADLPNLDTHGHYSDQINYLYLNIYHNILKPQRCRWCSQTSRQSLRDPLSTLWDVFPKGGWHGHQDQEYWQCCFDHLYRLSGRWERDREGKRNHTTWPFSNFQTVWSQTEQLKSHQEWRETSTFPSLWEGKKVWHLVVPRWFCWLMELHLMAFRTPEICIYT